MRFSTQVAGSVFLSHFDGSDGSSTFTDEYANTVTPSGNATLTTAVKKFGTASARLCDSCASFGGDASADKLTVTSHADFAFGTGDFTIEFWANRTSATSDNLVTFAGQNWNVYYTQSGTSLRFFDGAADRITGGSLSGGWHHIALTRSGTSVRLFIDGTQTGSTYTDSGPTNLTQAAVLVGHYPASATYHDGYMRDLRITKGVARYTGNFTAPTAQFADAVGGDADFASVVLLCHMTGEHDATTFADVEGHTVTPSGTSMKVTMQQSPFNPYLTISSAECLAFGTGDFTIEFWVNRFRAASADLITFAAENWSLFYSQSETALKFWDGATARITGSSLATGTQYHVALTRAGTTVRLFVDGTLVGSSWTDSGPTNLTQSAVLVGHYPSASNFCPSYVDELRITKGLARYTANFTAPSGAFAS